MPIASDPNDVPVSQLLQRVVCTMVDHPEEVTIQVEAEADGATLTIHANPEDVGKVIGSQGRTAKSLRTIVSGIGRKLGRRFTIVIDEGEDERAHAGQVSREKMPS
jgi:predicted RNA-binding protein YlqC (UPF0109 family)